MKKSFLIITTLLLLLNLSCSQEKNIQRDLTEQAAISVANSWLSLVSEEKYGESWDEAANLFKNAVSKEQWKQALSGLLSPFGACISREVISAKYMTSLPGVPNGEYVVITFKTEFEEKSEAIETVTPMKDTDGVWRVSGYFIK